MDDVEREAQDRGYSDGKNFKSCSPKRYDYVASNHIAAYKRGWQYGRKEYEKTYNDSPS